MELNNGNEHDNPPILDNDELEFYDAVDRDIDQFFSDENIENRHDFLVGLLSAKQERGELLQFVQLNLDIFSFVLDKLQLPLSGSARPRAA